MTQTQSNVDPAEISKFGALASRWWDPEGQMKSLHDINPLRANFIDLHADIAGKKVLDVGCGAGILSEALAQRGGIVSAIDMAQESLDVAKLHLYESNLEIDYQLSTAEDFAEKHTEQFDVITCMEMLEHVPDPASVIHACAKLVKPGGHVFFSTINRNAKSYAFAVLAAEYVLGLVPKGTHHYTKLLKPSELAAWMRQCNLSIQTMQGMQYNPISKQYYLNDNTDVNYLVHSTKLA